MPRLDLSEGTYTIEQVLNFTAQSKFKGRFEYAKRDRVKMIKIKKVHVYSSDRTTAPDIRFEVISSSTPQYRPYSPSRDKRGRYRKTQNSIKHEYDTTIVFGREGVRLDTTQWKMAVGSMRRVPKNIPQNKVAQIHSDTRRKLEKWYGKGTTKYKEAIKKIKKSAKYISDGDFLAQVYGLNLDFIYRFAYVYWSHGHLYGRNYYGNVPAKKTNPQNIMAFPKHAIVIIKELMKQGILTK